MKKLLFLSGFIMTTLFSNSQNIGDVKRNDDGFTTVYDDSNHQIASGYVGDRTYDWDFSSCMIVIRVKDSKWTVAYDEKLQQIASGYTGEAGYSFKVVSCQIVLKKSDGWKMTYDKRLNLLESGW